MACKIKSLLSLPQENAIWYCAIRCLRTWIEIKKDSGEFVRPHVYVVVHQNTSTVLNLEVLQSAPTPDEVQQKLYQTMLKPLDKIVSPNRPLEIHFEDRSLADSLHPTLQEVGVVTAYKPQRRQMSQLLDAIQKGVFDAEDKIPGLLKQPGVKPEVVGRLFDAALAFFRAQLWIHLVDVDLLAILVSDQRDPYYVSIMGNAGHEYGLCVFRSWQEVETFFTVADSMDAIPQQGRHVFLYNQPPYVSFNDIDAIEKYGWQLPASNLYPTPLLFMPDKVLRPKTDMLQWYEAVLRALPVFVEKYLQANSDGSYPPAETELKVQTSAGEVKVCIRYPGGDLTQVRSWTSRRIKSSSAVELASLPFPDRRGMEGYIARFTADMGGFSMFIDPAIGAAQNIMYDAWDEPDPARRVRLAKIALKTSPLCADAYVLLAEQTRTRQQSLELYQSGVDAGRRALGEKFFADDENLEHFWGIMETRPFMRALQGLATTLWDLNRPEEALAHYRELLRLNPGDNQGIRYLLLDLLFELGRVDDVETLLKDYLDDWSADWSYSETLLAFRKFGDSRQAKKALKHALEVNQHVVDYLTGKKRIPSVKPPYITMGGEDEAIQYASQHLNYWRKTPGAVAWLAEAI